MTTDGSSGTRTPTSRRLFRRRVLPIAMSVMIGGVGAACGGASSDAGGQSGELETVSLGISTTNLASTFAQLAVAEELGYFEAEGIEIDPIFIGSSGAVLQAEAAGKVDIGMATPDVVLQAIDKGQSIQLVYNWGTKPVQKFAVLPESPVQKIADLRGKTIGVQELSSGPAQLARASLTKAGVTPDKEAKFVAVGKGAAALGALQQGRVDALMLYDSLYAAIESSTGTQLRYMEPTGVEDLFSSSFTARQEWIDQNTKLVEGFGRAWAKGTVWTYANPQEAIRIMWELYPNSKSGDTEEESMKIGMARFEARMDSLYGGTPPEQQKWGQYPPSAVEHWIEFAHEFDLIGAKFAASDVYTNEFVPGYNDFDAEAVKKSAKSAGGGE